MSSCYSKGSSCSSRSLQSRQTKSTNPTSNSTSANNTKGSRRRSSAYDADFEQYLIDHGIFPEEYEHPDGCETPEPSNLEWIRQRLAQIRRSLSPSSFPDSKFRDFKRANARVIDEGEVMSTVLPEIHSTHPDILNKKNKLFTRLESITNRTTVDAQLDFYNGARLEDIDRRVLEDIDKELIDRQA